MTFSAAEAGREGWVVVAARRVAAAAESRSDRRLEDDCCGSVCEHCGTLDFL
jgi:hypothetical protein